MCNTQFSPLNSKRVILELCVRTFTCEHVYVVLATLASASPREIQDKLLALQRLLCFFLVFLFALSSQLRSFRITSESLCLVPPLVWPIELAQNWVHCQVVWSRSRSRCRITGKSANRLNSEKLSSSLKSSDISRFNESSENQSLPPAHANSPLPPPG